ncbi:glycine--tRNA ligase subunit alpha, partial [candidate division WOR-3 bacterium]|nr:glycine--tRNA ligase subunit alpha [candidate division WOR-3 bacterium]MBD3365492.1 glycine--tRNA ligase subunit alpha [candidate division WOR-3 bacterium]
MSFQDIIRKLQDYWIEHGCVLVQPYSSEVGAGTFNPATFLKVLDDKPWRCVYVEPSKRPRDGRYGENPLRVYQHWQLQAVLKPAPENAQELYLDSLRSLGIPLESHDVRFTEDDWESPTLGAWGLGWQVDMDGIEITQFTYFQQVGGLDIAPEMVPVEYTYGLARIAMFLQGVQAIPDIKWGEVDGKDVTWGDVFLKNEQDFSAYSLKEADIGFLRQAFEHHEAESVRLVKKGLVMPAYDAVIKCSHYFNLLDARGAISVTERAATILRVRKLAMGVAKLYRYGPEADEGLK